MTVSLYGGADEVAFTFSRSRGQGRVMDTLKDFSGTLLTDGYSAYEKYASQSDKESHAQCWVRARRYFERAQQAEPIAATQALKHIVQLYHHEQRIRDKQLSASEKLNYRMAQSAPQLAAFFTWCNENANVKTWSTATRCRKR